MHILWKAKVCRGAVRDAGFEIISDAAYLYFIDFHHFPISSEFISCSRRTKQINNGYPSIASTRTSSGVEYNVFRIMETIIYLKDALRKAKGTKRVGE